MMLQKLLILIYCNSYPDPFLVAASDFWPEIETIEFNDRRLDQLFLQYWISIEALLSLIAALIQAPDYFYGWIVASSRFA